MTDLLRKEKCNGDTNQAGLTPMMSAAVRGHADVVGALAAAGADIDAGFNGEYSHPVGATALWFAVHEGHAGVVEALLRAGADPNQTPVTGRSLLVDASWNETSAVMKLLVDAGARGIPDVITDGRGPSALVFAYLESIGTPTDTLSSSQLTSLRWEAANQPSPGSSSHARARFTAEVLVRATTITPRELAIRRARSLTDHADILVPALLAVAMTTVPIDYTSPLHAVEALKMFAWGREFEQQLPKLMAIASDLRNGVARTIGDLLATRAPLSRRLVDVFIANMRDAPDSSTWANQLGILLARATEAERSLVERGRKVLEKAARAKVDESCGTVACHRTMELTKAARDALSKLP